MYTVLMILLFIKTTNTCQTIIYLVQLLVIEIIHVTILTLTLT